MDIGLTFPLESIFYISLYLHIQMYAISYIRETINHSIEKHVNMFDYGHTTGYAIVLVN